MKPLTLALLLLASGVRAEVREISTMAQIRPELTPSTLLVFDIDNTLVEPLGNIGSDQWYYYLVKAIARDDKTLTADAAETKAGDIWTKTLKTVTVQPVEAITPALIREQQKLGLTVMALTARGPEDEAATLRQLKDLGYDLNARTIVKNGVVLMGDGDKGAVLLDVMKKAGYKPKRVVFVDDKLKNVKAVDAALTAAGVPVLCFRYGATDAKVRAFNEVIGEAGDKANADLLFHGRAAK